jgi:hypothetical protein
MADQVLTASSAVRDGSAAVTMYAAQAADNKIDFADAQDEKLALLVTNGNTTEGQTATITIAAGSYWRKDLGTLTVEVAYNSAQKIVGPLDSARFKDSAGKATVAVAVTASGTVSSVKLGVIKLP